MAAAVILGLTVVASARAMNPTAGADDRPGSQFGGDEVALGRGRDVDTLLVEETALRSAWPGSLGRSRSRLSEFWRLKVACLGSPTPTGLDD